MMSQRLFMIYPQSVGELLPRVVEDVIEQGLERCWREGDGVVYEKLRGSYVELGVAFKTMKNPQTQDDYNLASKKVLRILNSIPHGLMSEGESESYFEIYFVLGGRIGGSTGRMVA